MQLLKKIISLISKMGGFCSCHSVKVIEPYKSPLNSGMVVISVYNKYGQIRQYERRNRNRNK